MGDSLKDQLLKLGLVPKKAETRPPHRDARHARGAPPRRDASPAPAKQDSAKPSRPYGGSSAPAPSTPSAPSPRQLREIERARAARQARVRERIEAHKLNDPQAEIKHYYSTGKKIKWLYVTDAQQTALLRGEIVIVVAQGRGWLVASSLVASLREIDPELRVVDPGSVSESDGDPTHEVPDDLRW